MPDEGVVMEMPAISLDVEVRGSGWWALNGDATGSDVGRGRGAGLVNSMRCCCCCCSWWCGSCCCWWAGTRRGIERLWWFSDSEEYESSLSCSTSFLITVVTAAKPCLSCERADGGAVLNSCWLCWCCCWTGRPLVRRSLHCWFESCVSSSTSSSSFSFCSWRISFWIPCFFSSHRSTSCWRAIVWSKRRFRHRAAASLFRSRRIFRLTTSSGLPCRSEKQIPTKRRVGQQSSPTAVRKEDLNYIFSLSVLVASTNTSPYRWCVGAGRCAAVAAAVASHAHSAAGRPWSWHRHVVLRSPRLLHILSSVSGTYKEEMKRKILHSVKLSPTYSVVRYGSLKITHNMVIS